VNKKKVGSDHETSLDSDYDYVKVKVKKFRHCREMANINYCRCMDNREQFILLKNDTRRNIVADFCRQIHVKNYESLHLMHNNTFIVSDKEIDFISGMMGCYERRGHNYCCHHLVEFIKFISKHFGK
jgi:hypothetical protein